MVRKILNRDIKLDKAKSCKMLNIEDDEYLDIIPPEMLKSCTEVYVTNIIEEGEAVLITYINEQQSVQLEVEFSDLTYIDLFLPEYKCIDVELNSRQVSIYPRFDKQLDDYSITEIPNLTFIDFGLTSDISGWVVSKELRNILVSISTLLHFCKDKNFSQRLYSLLYETSSLINYRLTTDDYKHKVLSTLLEMLNNLYLKLRDKAVATYKALQYENSEVRGFSEDL